MDYFGYLNVILLVCIALKVQFIVALLDNNTIKFIFYYVDLDSSWGFASLPFLMYRTRMSSSTSDYKRNASDVRWLLWILHGVHAFVSLTHSVYNEVAEMAVEFGPTVDHDAAPHQDHLGCPRSGPVPKSDLHLEHGQHDVEILPVEQGHGVLIDWIIRWTEKRGSIDKHTGQEKLIIYN